MSSKNQKLNLNREKLYDLYINQQLTSKEVAEIFDCTSRCVRNYLIKYGIPVRQMSEAVKLERSKWSAEKEMARSKKYIQTWADTPEERKREIIAERTKNINSPEAILKAKETRFANGTHKSSLAENEFYQKLCLFIDKSDIERGYVDKQRYPFNCDFYIKSKDLFIEYQGHQTHGYEPYDATNPEHRVYCDRLQASGFDTYNWTTRDPNKVAFAKQHKINLLLIYPKNNSYLIHNGIMTSIGKFNVTKINDLC